ncbi:helix-turn-helix transcriptional regulator [uncultured Georgenia sp.]|uniref:TOBE domain-containing protein n=1 Tax=uncultured Georgenia sp. TaxID=378209 RepID=UPI00260AA8B2|nr:helix-turn-helix transcriptional regulator [uncultured Georgenia sp.]HLV04670.1 helix-turn-helix transcriptional regulator [Actinomycetaceae bacterium]
MPQFRIGQAASLLGVSDDTVRRWVDDGRLEARRDDAGRMVLDGADLARFAQELAERRRLPEVGGVSTSARNRFTGLVTRVLRDGVMAQVDLQCGPFRVVSLMSAEAVEELGLTPGSLASAVVKATTVVVEAPQEGT